MKRKITKELRRFSRAKLGPVPVPRRRSWIRRVWDWMCGVEEAEPINYERRAYRNMKKQFKRWKQRTAIPEPVRRRQTRSRSRVAIQ